MMKKYKLIKEYPGSKKLGTIVQNQHDSLYFPETKETNSSTGRNYFQKMVACQPEFWEEVVEKEYEILSFKTPNNNSLMVGKTTQGWYTGVLEVGSNDFRKEEWLLNHEYLIESVKRLSDGEVFTVGDVVDERLSNYKSHTISKFRIHFNELCIYSVKGSLNVNLQLCFLNKLKQPIFTTEDGVDIFEDNDGEFRYWRLNIPSINTNPSCEWRVSDAEVICKNMIPHNTESVRKSGILRFSTKEAAEEYILMNKSDLSINDVVKYLIKHMPLAYKRDIIINDLKERR